MNDQSKQEDSSQEDSSHIHDGKPIEHPEIFIGLVSPTGVDLKAVCEELFTALTDVKYKPELIKLSDILKGDKIKAIHGVNLNQKYEDERIHALMTAGNELRAKMKRNDALSLLTTAKIRDIRKNEQGEPNKYIPKKAYVLRSFKNKDEINTLKNIYGSSFFVISAYSPRDKRRDEISKRIASSHGKPSNADKYTAEAEKLINRDYDEDDVEFGQEVSGAFPLADLFVEVEPTRTKLKNSINRFIHSLFGYPFHTPTKDEFGMFLAFSVALRSADLSRQVGAAVLNSEGDLLAIGCNEVPKFDGGQYWEDDPGEKARDFEMGGDSGAYMKAEILEETISNFKELGLVTDGRTAKDITKELLYGEKKQRMKDADITNLLEYGRMIHAEMAAISDAAKRGISLRGATLYCTTFPCHMCARHIVASGIRKVMYIEPYPKSKAQKLYPDSIAVDPSQIIEDKVCFMPFAGIAPYRFHDFFRHKKRKKDDGDREPWSTAIAKPKIRTYNPMSYIDLEITFTEIGRQKIENIAGKLGEQK